MYNEDPIALLFASWYGGVLKVLPALWLSPLRGDQMAKIIEPETIRILVVDDSEISRRITRTILRSRDWTVCGEAENGKDGVEKFQELKPDVVLLDLSMPDMTGIEAAQQMSATDHTIPLILFTILDVEGIGVAAHNAGIQAIIPKTKAWNLIGSIESIVNR
jgi:two-component system chemotaxis response regulator CheY